MTITEPGTLLTDYALGALALFLGLRLAGDARRSRQRSTCLWTCAFMALGAASAAGGTYHGFSTQLSPSISGVVWGGTLLAIGVANLLALSGTAFAAMPQPGRRWVLAVIGVKFLAYGGLVARDPMFLFAILDHGLALVAILVLLAFVGPNRVALPWFVGGVASVVAGAAVQQGRYDLHPSFNHNDLYHVIQMGATYLLYRGARLLADRRELRPFP